MEPSRNFENFRAKSSVFPMKIRSSDGEHSDGYVPLANLMCERKTASDSIVIPGVMKFARLLNSHSISYSPSVTGEDKLLRFPNFTFLPSRGRVFERSESGNCDLETERIWSTTLDFVGEVAEGSHTKAITNANTDSSKQQKTILGTSSQVEISGNKRSHTQSASPFFEPGNKLMLREVISGASEGSRNFQHIGSSRFTIYNKLSADRNAMNKGLSAEMSNSGANYVASAKDHNNPTGSSSEYKRKSLGESGIPWKAAASVDVNKQLVTLPAGASSAHSKWTTTSRTQKLHPSIRLYSADQSFPKSHLLEDDYCEHRWVKRLKVTPSSPVLTTSRLAADHSSPTHVKPCVSRRHGKEPILIGGDDEGVPDVALSHFWIKRFLRNELHKKQFPSIAAMAVVGRTMNGHGSCEFRKKGSITIWSTNAF